MRAAEDALFAGGMTVEALMERAGTAVAEAAWRLAGRVPTLILCGPGNNGGDGYVVARLLKAMGVPVRVAALGEPRSPAARKARSLWDGAIEPLDTARPARLLIDALFGTGLSRPLDPAYAEPLARLAQSARLQIAVDLPSGVGTDDGRLLGPALAQSMTIALGALKPAHRLQPAAALMGRLVVADIGVAVASSLSEIARPHLPAPGPADHKYTRGQVVVVAGAMPGATHLTAGAAQRAGAGYVTLAGGTAGGPFSIVHRVDDLGILADARVSAVAIGPGLGRDAAARRRLDAALAADHPLVLDADALTLLADRGLARLKDLGSLPILTPHEGEFARLFGDLAGNRIDRVRQAAAKAGAVVVLKGADTVVAAPDGRAAIAPPAPGWLASAGTGDVLAGIVAAVRARGVDPFEAACAGVWLHGHAARRAGPGLIADDLIEHLAASLGECA